MKHIEKGLDHKNFREITIKYHSEHRNRKYEVVAVLQGFK